MSYYIHRLTLIIYLSYIFNIFVLDRDASGWGEGGAELAELGVSFGVVRKEGGLVPLILLGKGSEAIVLEDASISHQAQQFGVATPFLGLLQQPARCVCVSQCAREKSNTPFDQRSKPPSWGLCRAVTLT